MEITKISVIQLATFVTALSTIVAVGFTVDSRYAKKSDIDELKQEVNISLDRLHQKILENEQLKQQLGSNTEAIKLLDERNKQDLAEIRQRLAKQKEVRLLVKTEALGDKK